MLMLIVIHCISANCQYPSALGIVSFNDGNHGKGGTVADPAMGGLCGRPPPLTKI